MPSEFGDFDSLVIGDIQLKQILCPHHHDEKVETTWVGGWGRTVTRQHRGDTGFLVEEAHI